MVGDCPFSLGEVAYFVFPRGRKDLDEAMVLIPSNSELEHMDAQMNPIVDKVIANNIQIQKLEKLRDTLLPKLMSGEVRVKMKEA